MKTITVKVKFVTDKGNKIIKLDLEFPKYKYPCFGEIVDKVYSTNESRLNKLFKEGYIKGIEV